MTVTAHFRMRPRTAVLVGSAVVLAWLVVSRSIGAYLADAAPQAALWMDAQQPEALVTLAEQAVINANMALVATADIGSGLAGTASATDRLAPINIAPTRDVKAAFSAFERIGPNQSITRPIAPANASAVRDWAKIAVLHEPLNARALRILGQLAEAEADDTSASKFMAAANRLSLHEPIATYWLLRASAEAQDYKSAIRYADVILRTTRLLNPAVVPILALICADKNGAALIEAVLADNPPWRTQFIAALPNDVPDARTPLGLLLALRDAPVPLTADDIDPYIERLVTHKFYSLAYYTWLQFLPPDELRRAGLLFNGNFDEQPSGLPFDWKITQGSGVTVDIVPRPGKAGAHALMVDFEYGRVDYRSVTELVMLAPAAYRFSGEYQSKLVGPRGMKWRVVCANGTTTSAGESPMIIGKTAGWENLAFTFTVPATDCPAQYVRLDLDARMASEELVSGSVLFGGLQISRVANRSTTGG